MYRLHIFDKETNRNSFYLRDCYGDIRFDQFGKILEFETIEEVKEFIKNKFHKRVIIDGKIVFTLILKTQIEFFSYIEKI